METKVQVKFFNQLLQRFPRKADAVEELSTTLNLSRDAVYRRLRGDTLLTPDELLDLAKRYRISLDGLALGDSDLVFFSYNTFTNPVKNLTNWLGSIHTDIKRVMQAPDAHIFYASLEIPVFHYLFFPNLLAFKFYVWGKTSWQLDFLKNRPFSFDLLTPNDERIANNILDNYLRLPTTELWSLNIADHTLNQIEYTLLSGNFTNQEAAKTLCEQLLQLVQHERAMATAGSKFRLGQTAEELSADFNLFHNEIVHTNNTFLVKTAVGNTVYTTLSNPNFLQSTDPRLCANIENWFQNIIAQSNSISRHSAKSRGWFFSGLERKIEATMKRIELF
ncbi:MAG: helix-turn-helix domain-containing protein [Saprospiraceae bacterium]